MDTLAIGVGIIFVVILALAATNIPDQFYSTPTTILYLVIAIVAIIPVYFIFKEIGN